MYRRLRSAVILAVVMGGLDVGCGGPPPEPGDTRSTGAEVSREPVSATPGLTPAPSATPTPIPTAAPSPEGGVFGAMLEAIRESSPPGSRLALGRDRLDGDWIVDGDVDDGRGPGRLLVVVSDRAGTFTANPCADPDYRQGADCVRRHLDGGRVLVLRGAVDFEGSRTVDVTLIHADRSGVSAEASNWSIGQGLKPPRPGLELPPMPVTRPEPLFSVDELAQLVLAVDELTRACIEAGCE